MTSRSCPDLPTLEELLRDTLPATQQECLAEHLGRCEACRARLEDLAMPTHSILPDGVSGATRASPPAHVPPRELFERWSGPGPPTGEPLPPLDATETVRHLIEPTEHPDELGRLGPYHVIKVIGQGGMGIVVLARDPDLRRQVALKLMQPTLAAHPEARKRFLREARAAAAVHDDHVVIIHAVESGRDVPYLVMEYIPGRSLQDHLSAGEPLPPAQVAALGAQVAAGLAAAHARGLVHRDVKPANILIDARTGRAKLTDFGLARAGDDPSLTRPGVVAGTPDYMAPEQARGQAVDYRADLYSLGAVLYAAATRRPPLTASSTRALLRKLRDEAPTPVRSSAPDMPAALARIIERLLEKEPTRRPESAESVARALRDLAGSSAPFTRRRTIGPVAVAIGFACVVTVGVWMARGLGLASPHHGSCTAPAAITPGPGGPFSLGGVRRFDTLAAAIAVARSGATIEIDGDGPFLSGPIRLRAKALTLRAARGSRPVLRFVPADEAVPTPWLETDASLTLEGLEVHSTVNWRAERGDDLSQFSAIAVRDGPFRAVHCRFFVSPRNGCLALRNSSGEVRACQFSAAEGFALYWAPGSDHAMDLRQDILAAHGAIIIDADRLDAGPGKATLHIDRTTVRANSAVQILGEIGRRTRSFAVASRLDVCIEADNSVFDASHILALVDATSARRFRVPPMESIAPQLKARITWRGHENLYSPGPSWLSFASRSRKITAFADGPADLVAWERLWDGTDTGSAVVKLSFRGSCKGANPADHALIPSEGSGLPRQRLPRGADVERSGPGAAYDAWRTSTAL